MTRTSHRARILGSALIAFGVAATSVGVTRAAERPHANEPTIESELGCGVRERRLFPFGSVFVIVPCPTGSITPVPGRLDRPGTRAQLPV